MRSETYIPCERLQPFVKCFTIQESADERVYTVLPDTTLVMGFQFNGRLTHINKESEILLSRSGISGLAGSYKIFKNAPETGTVLVYFKEAGAAAFFREPLHELFQESLSLEYFMLRSDLQSLEEQLCQAKADKEKIGLIEKFLISRIIITEPDRLVSAAIAQINKSKGGIRIKQLVKHLYTSQSPLEKRFRKAVGASPRKYASIVRMKNAIQLYRANTSMTTLSYDAGFYDQSHFIKEFKAFTGKTPDVFFRRPEKNDFLQL